MRITDVLSSTDLVNDALLALKVFFFSRSLEVELPLTVDNTSEKGFRTCGTLVEGCFSPFVDLAFSHSLRGHRVHLFFKCEKCLDVGLELWAVGQLVDWMLAGWTCHEFKTDS